MLVFIEQNELYIITVLAGVCILLFLMCVISLAKVLSLKDRINAFMKTGSSNDIENMLSEYIEKTRSVSERFDELKSDISDLQLQIVPCVQKIGVVRFNPFDDVGGDLSFAVAFLDSNNDGVVISSLYSRECSYCYAKEIKNGKPSSHKLSGEEQEAVNKAAERHY